MKRIGVGSVVGDELFLAVVFLGTAFSRPALQDDGDNDDGEGGGGGEVHTGEFGVVLAFPSPMR